MALIVRIDVDRPYGKHPLARHLLSRFGSDAYLPRMEAFGYLTELKQMLQMLNEKKARAYVFFRACTLPSESVCALLDEGHHEVGLHLEDSRSFDSFDREKANLERHIGKTVDSMSKHGSGGGKYGRRHYAPYEPDKYIEWAQRASMKVFFGNLEDPTLPPQKPRPGFLAFPSAFWLEPHWRDSKAFPVDWLLARAGQQDTVMLVHPENVLESPGLAADFQRIIGNLETKVLDSIPT
jgi:hypothetical protein